MDFNDKGQTVEKKDKKTKKAEKSDKPVQESTIDKVVTSNVPESVYQLDVYIYSDNQWILDGKAVIIRGRANDQAPYKYLLQTSWHVVVDAIQANSPMKIVNPKNGKFCYKYRLDQWTCRNEVMDFCWCKVTDSTISKLGARAYDAALDFYDENTKISIGQAAVKGASNYQFVKHSLVPMAINYEISTVNSDSGSALFVLGKPLVIGVHNWGLNNNVNNRGVCLIGEYRRFFLGHVEGEQQIKAEQMTETDCTEVAIPESDTGYSRKMKFLERQALEDWDRENRDSDYYTRGEIDSYDINFNYNRITGRRRNGGRANNRPNDGGVRYRHRDAPSMAVTLEYDDDSHAHLYYTDDNDIVPQAVARTDVLDQAIRAYMTQQRLDSFNIHSLAQFDGFLNYLDNREYEEALYRVSNIVNDANDAREAIESGELGIGQGVEWATVESSASKDPQPNQPQKESMYKAINKNSKQIHKATAKTENAMSDIDLKFQKMTQNMMMMQESIFNIFRQQAEVTAEQKQKTIELDNKVDQLVDSLKNFQMGASKQEKPSSGSNQQEDLEPKEKKNTSNNQKYSNQKGSKSSANWTSKNTNHSQNNGKKTSTENVKTTTSQSLDQTVNSEVLNKVSKLEGMLTKLAENVSLKSQDTCQTSTQM